MKKKVEHLQESDKNLKKKEKQKLNKKNEKTRELEEQQKKRSQQALVTYCMYHLGYSIVAYCCGAIFSIFTYYLCSFMLVKHIIDCNLEKYE